jgi:hypothetical protein
MGTAFQRRLSALQAAWRNTNVAANAK